MVVNKLYGGRAQTEQRALELMDKVGLARRLANAYPHELDGGRRQRIGVARALAVNPKFIVCDEPVSALDVSIQAQILNLLMDLQDELGLTYLFITHDLSVVRHISNEIMVMYLGQCIERGPSAEILSAPFILTPGRCSMPSPPRSAYAQPETTDHPRRGYKPD